MIKSFYRTIVDASLGLLALMLLVSCASTNSGSHFEPGATLAGRTTFRFLPDRTIDAAEAVSNRAYWRNAISQDIVAALNAKGYRFFPTRQTDFLVAYHIVLKDNEAVTTFDNYYGYDLSADQLAQADLSKFQDPKRPGAAEEGILVIDIIDPKQRALLWRGWTKSSLNRQKPSEQLQAQARLVVERTLASLPSRTRR
ncbi:MAG: DUF4136 domain-containing protein [Chthoniobacterales bacterium]